jgi:hypothetical protein
MRRWASLLVLLPIVVIPLMTLCPGCGPAKIDEGCTEACSTSMGCSVLVGPAGESDAMVQCTAHCENQQVACSNASTAFQTLLNCIAWMPCTGSAAVGVNCGPELEQVNSCSGNPVEWSESDASLFGEGGSGPGPEAGGDGGD